MKNVLLIVFIVFVLILGGCVEEVRTPPWTDYEIEEMENKEVTCVPILQCKF